MIPEIRPPFTIDNLLELQKSIKEKEDRDSTFNVDYKGAEIKVVVNEHLPVSTAILSPDLYRRLYDYFLSQQKGI